MTPQAAVTSLRTNAPLRNLAVLGALLLLWTTLVFGWSLWAAYDGDWTRETAAVPTRLQILSAYFAPLAGGLFIGYLICIMRQGTGWDCPGQFWGGCLFIAGAAVLDVSVTFYFSPDLVDEGNPVVRTLLDSGHELPWVMAYMLLTTLAVIGTFCTFWGAFLAHRPFLLRTIHEARPPHWIDFLKAATGGARLSLRQWLFPCRWSELPRLYHGIWMVGIAIVFGITLFRYYVSLEWLGLFEPVLHFRLIALASSVTVSLAFYFVLLARDYQKVSTT